MAKKEPSKKVGVYVEIPRELRDLLREMKIPIAETARAAFLEVVKRKTGEKTLGKKLDALVGNQDAFFRGNANYRRDWDN